ncbi:MAG: hypothetical protein RLZZ427_1537 [Pseudomonadota bacterium]|jgi:phosphate transport system substrate-binding protein
MWNDSAQEVPLRLDAKGQRSEPGRERVGMVAADRCAITFADAGIAIPGARAFRLAHPHIHVELTMLGSDAAMGALATAATDIALIGREATKPEVQAFEWIYRRRPTPLPVLRGSIATPGKLPAVAVLVHASNPITSISLAQLAAVFDGQGRGISHWGELGVAGPLSRSPINLYAPYMESGTGRFFRNVVLNDSNRIAWQRLHEFGNPENTDASEDLRSAQHIERAIATDAAGLALGMATFTNPRVRVLGLQNDAHEAIMPSKSTIINGSYPLARTVFAYSAGQADSAGHPETGLFLNFMRSSTAQGLIAPTDGYLALQDG